MADLLKDVNYLRFYYSSDDAMKDKDLNKNQLIQQYNKKVSVLFGVPLAFQVW